MSLCSIRLKSPAESEAFRAQLQLDAVEGLKLFRTEQRINSAFRCAAKMGDMKTVHIRDFASMCEQCMWSKLVDSDDESDDDASGGGDAQLFLPSAMDALQRDVVRLEQEKLAAEYQRNKLLERSGSRSSVMPLWRDGKDKPTPRQDGRSSSSSSTGDVLATAMNAANEQSSSPCRYNVKESLGSGIQKRAIRSTVAAHNFLNALATRETKSLDLQKVSRHAVREAFSFCVRDGRDVCELHEFCMMLFLFAKHYFPDANEEFGHIYALDRLWDHSIGHFVEEYTATSLEHVAERLPIASFPGMDLVHAMYGEVCRLSYTLVGGGSPVALPDVLRFAMEADVYALMPHVSANDVEAAFHFAKDNSIAMDASLRSTVPQGCVNDNGFVDFLAVLGFFAFRLEPRHTQLPTLASKCESMILFLSAWYERRSGHVLAEEVTVPPRDLPQIVSMEPLVVAPGGRDKVTIVGKLFPSHGVYVRFGPSWVTMTSPRDPELGTNQVYPPPVEVDKVEVLIRCEQRRGGGGDGAAVEDDPSTAECVVRRFKSVRIAVSTDGIVWNPYRGKRFVYERLEAPVSVAAYVPRLQRIFIHYASCGGARPVDGFINQAEWLQFCRDYRFLPKVPDPDGNEAQSPAFRAAMLCFQQYSVAARDRTQKAIEGVKPRMVRALASDSFARCVLNCIVVGGTPLAQGLAENFATDQWIGRESLPDVPEARLGGHALMIRRAAKGSAMSRRAEGVGERHQNSPRGGRIALVETDPLPGADPEDILDLSAFVGGMWSNETELNKIAFRFLTTGDKDFIDDPAMRQNALNSLNYGKVHVKGTDAVSGDGMASSTTFTTKARDAVADARERTRLAVSEAIVENHRSALNATYRRSLDADVRHKRQVQRLELQLQEAEQERKRLEEQVRQTAQLNSDAAPMLHNTGNGVLQAEKEALHRVFVYELEKRKALLAAQSARDENLRDVERNRVLKDMKDRLVDSDVSFGRLQDVVIGQSETIERQGDVLRLLKDRATILTADVMYYRAAHTKLLAIVSEDPEKMGVVEHLNQEKASHENNIETVLTDMRLEAKAEGKKPPPSGIKELTKLHKQKGKAGAPGDVAEPLSALDFSLPTAPKLKVSLTADEAEERTREAVREVEETKNLELKAMTEQLEFLKSRLIDLGGDEEEEEEEDGDPSSPFKPDGTPKRASSRTPGSRAQRRRGTGAHCAEIDVQTDPLDDAATAALSASGLGRVERTIMDQFAPFFGPDVPIAQHAIQPTDTFASIAERYHVPIDVLYLANFIEPPHLEAMSAVEEEEEMKLVLFGIASKTLRVPLAELEGATPRGGAMRSLFNSGVTSRVPSRQRGVGDAGSSSTPSLMATPRGGPTAYNKSSSVPSRQSATPLTHRERAVDAANGGGDAALHVRDPQAKPPLSSRNVVSPGHAKAHATEPNRPHVTMVADPVGREATQQVVGGDDDDGGGGDNREDDDGAASVAGWEASSCETRQPARGTGSQHARHRDEGCAIPGMEGILSAENTPRELLDIPSAMPVRKTLSFTPDGNSKRAERAVKRTEQELMKATAEIEEAIAAVSSQVVETGSAHLSPDRTGIASREGGQMSTTSVESQPLDRMSAYVETACAEAKRFQSTFQFEWTMGGGTSDNVDGGGTNDALLRSLGGPGDVPQQFVHHRGGGPIIKPRKARSMVVQHHRNEAGSPSSTKKKTEGQHHPLKTTSQWAEKLREVADPDWLVIVSAPVRDMVERTLATAAVTADEAINLAYKERLFLKAIRHFGEAELLRRLMVVREAQEFFQTMVQRFVQMHERGSREALQRHLELEATRSAAGTASDHRAATAEREAMRFESQRHEDDKMKVDTTVRRHTAEKEQRIARRHLLAEANAELAAANSKERKVVSELARLKRDLQAAPRQLLPRPKPKYLLPLPPETMLSGTQVVPPASPSSPSALPGEADPESPSKTKPVNAAVLAALGSILHSPVKLQPLGSRLPRNVDTVGTNTRPHDVAPRLPSSAVDQIELVAKAESLLMSRRGQH